jgi:4-oxalocrotonate tautomerase
VPHVVVKLWPGKSEQQKARLADAITKDVLHYGEESVSVAFEEVPAEEWAEKVYRPDIQAKWSTLQEAGLPDVMQERAFRECDARACVQIQEQQHESDRSPWPAGHPVRGRP